MGPLRKWSTRSLIVIVLMTSATARATPTQRYTVIVARSRLVAHLLKDGLASRFAHDHVVRATRFAGELIIRGDQPQALTLTVDARQLTADEPALRRAYGKKTMLDDSDRAKVQKNLHGAEQLHTTRYRTMRFVSTSFKAAGAPAFFQLEGKLTIRGVTRAVRLKVKLWRVGARIKGSGQLRLRQSHFGYKPYRAGLGLVKVRDEMTLDIYLEAHPSATTKPASSSNRAS